MVTTASGIKSGSKFMSVGQWKIVRSTDSRLQKIWMTDGVGVLQIEHLHKDARNNPDAG